MDGVYVASEGEAEPTFHQVPSLSSMDVADVLHVARVRIVRFLTQQSAIADSEQPELLDNSDDDSGLQQLAAAAVTGQVSAGPELRLRLPVALRDRGEVRVTGALLAGDGGAVP